LGQFAPIDGVDARQALVAGSEIAEQFLDGADVVERA
jgi:hypothetical protein